MAENTSALEAAWTTIAVAGAAVAVALAAHIWASYRAVAAWIGHGRARRWGPRHTFVLGFLTVAGLLVLIWLGFAALGVNAMLNPPPTDAIRAAASERGGWILVGLEGLLFLCQGVLMTAWIGVGRPSLRMGREPQTLAMLLLAAIDAGREIGHAVRNDLQPAVAVLDDLAHDETVSADLRARAVEALDQIDRLLAHVSRVHGEIKALEPRP